MEKNRESKERKTMKIKNKFVKIAVLSTAFALALTGCSSKDPNLAATVNGKEIAKEEYVQEYKLAAEQAMAQYGDDFLTQEGLDGSGKKMGEVLRENTLKGLIQMEILKQEAAKEKIEVTDEEVDQNISQMAEMYGGKEALDAALEEQNLTMDTLKEYTQRNLLMQKYTEKKMKDLEPTDEEIQKHYDQNKDKFNTVEASHILVEKKEEAEAIKKQLDEGGDFAAIAKEKSKDPGSAEKGGSLGTFSKGQMVKEFDEKVFSMKPGEISDPVKTQYGYHIIKLDKINDDFKSVKDAVKSDLVQTKFQNYMQDLEKKAKVKRIVDTSEEISVEAPKKANADTKADGDKKADTKNTAENKQTDAADTKKSDTKTTDAKAEQSDKKAADTTADVKDEQE